MPRPIALLLVVALIAAAGCNNEEFSRYPSVAVPEYNADDYARDLSNPNPELVYNAVCNLGATANDPGKTLGAEKPDPKSEEYRFAQTVHQQILGLLQHRDPQVVAASLRYLQLFSTEYKPKAKLIAPIAAVASDHPLVQFEQVTALGLLVTNTTRLPEPLLRRLLDSRSWIVSRSSYQLLGQLEHEPLRQELVRRYRETHDEQEQLLLLAGISQHPGPVETALLEQKSLTAASAKVRRTALAALGAGAGSGQPLAWLAAHYAQIQAEDRPWLFNAAAGLQSTGAVELVCLVLKQGYVPTEAFLQSLSDRLEAERGSAVKSVDLTRVEQAVSASSVAGRWQALREQATQRRDRFAALEKEYGPLAQEFAQKARAVLNKYQVPEARQNSFLQPISTVKPLAEGKE